MESFTVSVKITPANKAIPSLATTHPCFAPSIIPLMAKFISLMGEFDGPPGSPTGGVVERSLDDTPETVD